MEPEPEPGAEALLDAARRAVRAHLPTCELVYAFGSRVEGRSHTDSDLDLAVLDLAPLSAITRFALSEALATELRGDVDLVDLWAASSVMKTQIVARGRVLFEARPGLRAAFEGRALAEYARLNEERRPILDRIAREGSVFHG